MPEGSKKSVEETRFSPSRNLATLGELNRIQMLSNLSHIVPSSTKFNGVESYFHM